MLLKTWGISILIISLVALTAITALLLAWLVFNIVQSLNEAHFAAIQECVALNANATNGTVCLV